jgi:hypothetical protein
MSHLNACNYFSQGCENWFKEIRMPVEGHHEIGSEFRTGRPANEGFRSFILSEMTLFKYSLFEFKS